LARFTPKLALSNQGDVFWRASGVDANGINVDDAFLRNYEPIVQRFKTLVNGEVVVSIVGDAECFGISSEGRFFVGRVEVQAIGSVLVFVDFGLVRERAGCSGRNSGSLRRHSGEARLGQRLQLAMDGGPRAGALPIVLFSRNARLTADGCGASVPFGELMLAAPISQALVLAPWDGTNPSLLSTFIPASLSLVDSVFYAQGVFQDSSPTSYRLTNALQIEIGPP
jgi:hypothetical protein